MAKTDLLTELKGGASNFTFVGEAVVKEGSLAGEKIKEGSTWKNVDSSFGVKSDGNTVYAQIRGGYKIDKQTFNIQCAETSKYIEIKWNDRLNEATMKLAKDTSILRVGLERDEDGKIITKEFLHQIDMEAYLRAHLADGARVRVRGEIEYGEYNDDVTMRYNIKSVYSADSYTNKEGELVEFKDEATIKQAYLLDVDSLDRNWEKQLTKDGEVIVRAFVPQYMSNRKVNDKYVKLKKTVPLMKPFKLKMKDKESEQELLAKKKIVEKFLAVKKGKIRELTAIINVVDGYDTVTGGVEVSADIQELIDLGIMTLDDVQKQVTVRGNKVSELTFLMPAMKRDKEKGGVAILMNDDKYAPEVLIMPTVDGEDDDDAFDDADTTVVSDDEFDAMFN